LRKEQQNYLRNLTRSLLSIQNSGEVALEERDKETVIIVREGGQAGENPISAELRIESNPQKRLGQ
jgi:hypothetical protein